MEFIISDDKQLYKDAIKSKNCRIKISYNDPFIPNNDNITCICKVNNEIVGCGVATIYSPDSISRADQWDFEENRKRQIYIDNLWSSNHSGEEILKRLENAVKNKINILQISRHNIYVVALKKSNGFYNSQGYIEIETPDHPNDEDYVSSYQNGSKLKTWMAKPLYLGLQFEKMIQWNESYEYYFGECIARARKDMLKKMFNINIPSTLCFNDLENLETQKPLVQDVEWLQFITKLQTVIKNHCNYKIDISHIKKYIDNTHYNNVNWIKINLENYYFS